VRSPIILLTIVLSAVLALTPAHVFAQQRGVQPIPTPVPQEPEPTPAQRELAKKANLERQAEIKRDTDKLLKLATELKQYVDKTNADMLSLDVLKKAEEIEKLAHNVKERMKGPR